MNSKKTTNIRLLKGQTTIPYNQLSEKEQKGIDIQLKLVSEIASYEITETDELTM